MYRIEVINIVMAVPREASAAGNHEPHICVDIKRVACGPEITRATVFVVRQIGTHMLTRKVSVEGHVLATHLIVLQ